jgi:hypothetical protein
MGKVRSAYKGQGQLACSSSRCWTAPVQVPHGKQHPAQNSHNLELLWQLLQIIYHPHVFPAPIATGGCAWAAEAAPAEAQQD